MFLKKTCIIVVYCSTILMPAWCEASEVIISNPKITMSLSYGKQASITSLAINGKKVIGNPAGIFTTMSVGGTACSSLNLKETPVLTKTGNIIRLSHIWYGNKNFTIKENWIFSVTDKAIKWTIERYTDNTIITSEAGTPVFMFDSINTWTGAYQGYGGLAWFYLFNEKLNTYGVHTSSSNFWNSENGNGLNITVDAPGKNIAMKYVRTNDDQLAYSISVSDSALLPKLDSGTNRRRFLRGRTDVWRAYTIPKGSSSQTITMSYFDVNKKYGRGVFKGIDGAKVSSVLNP